MASLEPANTLLGLAVRVTVGERFGGGGGGPPPKWRTSPAEARMLCCLLSAPSVNVVSRYSIWKRRRPTCLLKLRSAPPPKAVAKEFSLKERLKNAEVFNGGVTVMSDSRAVPK